MKNYILVFIFSFFITTFYSQLDYRGWKTWQSINIGYKIDKKSKVEGVLSSRNRHALSTLDQLFIDLSYNRNLAKKQDISLGYRFISVNKEYNNQFVNRFNIDYSYKVKLISKHSLTFRNRIQAKIYYNKDILLADRLRLKYTYKFSKKIKLSVFTEGFYLLNQAVTFYKYRIGTSANYDLAKNLKLGLKYLVMNEVNLSNPKSFNVLSIAIKKTFK